MKSNVIHAVERFFFVAVVFLNTSVLHFFQTHPAYGLLGAAAWGALVRFAEGKMTATVKAGLIAILLLLCSNASMAQDTPTAITISGNFSSFSGGSVSASSNIGAALQVTQRISLGYNQITVPSLNRSYSLGAFNYTAPLSALLGKNLSKKFVFDVTQINVTAQLGLGKVTQTAPNPFKVMAESGGVYVSYPLSTHVSAQLIGVQYLHGGKNPSHALFSTGINFQF